MKYGDIYWVEFSSNSIGHEFRGRRPAAIIQSNAQIRKTNVISIMPLTANPENKMLDDIFIAKDSKNNLFADSVVKVYYIMSFDKSRFVGKIGIVDDHVLEKIKIYLNKHFNL